MLTNARYSSLKAALTRAKRNNPLAVLVAVEKALAEFDEVGWPDGWPTWRIALDDARWELIRDSRYENTDAVLARFDAALERFA